MNYLHTYAKKWAQGHNSAALPSPTGLPTFKAMSNLDFFLRRLGLTSFGQLKELLGLLSQIDGIVNDLKGLDSLKNTFNFESIRNQLTPHYINPIMEVNIEQKVEGAVKVNLSTKEVEVSGSLPSIKYDLKSLQSLLYQEFGKRKNFKLANVEPTFRQILEQGKIEIVDSESPIAEHGEVEVPLGDPSKVFPFDYKREELRALNTYGLSFSKEASNKLGKEVITAISSQFNFSEDLQRVFEKELQVYLDRDATRGELTSNAINLHIYKIADKMVAEYFDYINTSISDPFKKAIKEIVTLITKHGEKAPTSEAEFFKMFDIKVDIFMPYLGDTKRLTKQSYSLEDYSNRMADVDTHQEDIYSFLSNYYFNGSYRESYPDTVINTEAYYEYLTELILKKSTLPQLSDSVFSLIDGNILVPTGMILETLERYMAEFEVNITGASSDYNDRYFRDNRKEDQKYWRKTGYVGNQANWEFIGVEYFDEFISSKINVKSNFSYRNFVGDIRTLGVSL